MCLIEMLIKSQKEKKMKKSQGNSNFIDSCIIYRR